ncbi:MAG: restriction endonuclease subunit S, partial [Bacteroidales bacterium]|nr:restriction endonuclease subunit S [Bacteroidales bacterium]
VNYEKSKFWAGNSCYVLTVKDKDTFVQFFYRALSFKQYLLIENQQQGSIPAVNKNQLENFVLLFPPTLTEQRAIAEILSDMDEEIKTLEQKVEKMRNIKSGMMQQLLSGKIRLVGDEADNVRQFVENNFGEFALAAEQGKKFAGK